MVSDIVATPPTHGPTHWYWLSKVREECPSYWCLVDPNTMKVIDGDTTTTSLSSASPPAPNEVLASAICLVRSHWGSWSEERVSSSFTGKLVVVGLRPICEDQRANVVCLGVLDIPVRFQRGSALRAVDVPPPPSPTLQLATATFIIVSPSERGSGVGKALMGKLEMACWMSHQRSDILPDDVASSSLLFATLGKRVDGISLRTDSQVPFYEACGYRRGRTQQLVSERACFQKVNLKQGQLDGLASLFAARGLEAQRRIAAADQTEGKVVSSSSTPPTTTAAHAAELHPTGNSCATPASVWMLKVVREESPEPFTQPSLSATTAGARGDWIITEAAQETLFLQYGGEVSSIVPLFAVPPLRWQRQIGPSCGLTLLRMLREELLECRCAPPSVHNRSTLLASLPSLSSLYLSVSSGSSEFFTVFSAGDTTSSIPVAMVNQSEPPSLGEVLHAGLLRNVGERYLKQVAAAVSTFNNTVIVDCEVVPVESLLSIPLREEGVSTSKSQVWYAVPYDRSSSEAPSSTQGGQRAHWGIVVGEREPPQKNSVGYSDHRAQLVLQLQHGASKDVVFATAEELISSNQQLRQVAVMRQENGETCQAQLDGLRGQCVRFTLTVALS